MATTYTNSPTMTGTGFGTRLTAVISATATEFKTWNDARATRKSLGKMSDHLLNDIGLSRGDVERIR